MIRWRQRITAAGPNGHDHRGIPGDCLRAAVATLTDQPYDEVPHFAMWPVWWWDAMRSWARRRLGHDFACLAPVDGSIRQLVTDDAEWSGLVIGSGPSPRGPFRHVVVVDPDLRLVHDPHPSDAGVLHVDEVFVLTTPYDLDEAPLPRMRFTYPPTQ